MVDIANPLLPSWVEPDPLQGRAVDALGLQATADRIADLLVPGLSVLTVRARYYSFLSWARRACGSRADETKIHRLEVALAIRESRLHSRDRTEHDGGGRNCRFVGLRNLSIRPRDTPPSDPRDVYRVPVWRAYRASMQSLGLLGTDYALTRDHGVALAQAYSASCNAADTSGKVALPPSACLSELKHREASLLVGRLGLWRKGRRPTDDTSPEGRRDALERELRDHYANGYSLPEVLGAYEVRRDRQPSQTVGALREAAVWERLSVGLNAVFLLWLAHLRSPGFARERLVAARRKRRVERLPFSDIQIDDSATATAVQSVRRALAMRDRLEPRGGLGHCDTSAFTLGDAVVSGVPIGNVLEQLEERHVVAKGDDAWIRDHGQRKELARDTDRSWQLPSAATLHAYRLTAFGSILADLWRAHR
jgi:hypothetical protein